MAVTAVRHGDDSRTYREIQYTFRNIYTYYNIIIYVIINCYPSTGVNVVGPGRSTRCSETFVFTGKVSRMIDSNNNVWTCWKRGKRSRDDDEKKLLSTDRDGPSYKFNVQRVYVCAICYKPCSPTVLYFFSPKVSTRKKKYKRVWLIEILGMRRGGESKCKKTSLMNCRARSWLCQQYVIIIIMIFFFQRVTTLFYFHLPACRLSSRMIREVENNV